MHVLEGDVDRGVALDRTLTGEQLEEDEPGGVDVAAGIGDAALDLLGGEVGHGAEEHAVISRGGLGGDGPRQPEVGHLDLATVGDEHVLGLDVAVDVAGLVGGGEAGEDGLEDVQGGARGEGTLGVHHGSRGAPLDVLHREEDLPAVLALVEDGHHVGVAQPSGRSGLATEARDEGLVSREVGAHDLQGHLPVQPGVGGEQDRGHPAVGEMTQHPVPTVDEGADERVRGCGGHAQSLGSPPSSVRHIR